MPSIRQTYSGRLIAAADLLPLKTKRVAFIHGATLEVLGQGANAKEAVILDLVTTRGEAWPKRLPLNKTNALLLAAAYGDNTDGWAGKPIEVWAENTMFRGEVVPGIKVDVASSTGNTLPSPPATPEPVLAGGPTGIDDDVIPF